MGGVNGGGVGGIRRKVDPGQDQGRYQGLWGIGRMERIREDQRGKQGLCWGEQAVATGGSGKEAGSMGGLIGSRSVC